MPWEGCRPGFLKSIWGREFIGGQGDCSFCWAEGGTDLLGGSLFGPQGVDRRGMLEGGGVGSACRGGSLIAGLVGAGERRGSMRRRLTEHRAAFVLSLGFFFRLCLGGGGRGKGAGEVENLKEGTGGGQPLRGVAK